YTNKSEFEELVRILKKEKVKILIDIKNLEFLKWINSHRYDYLAVSFAISGRQIKKVRSLIDSKSVKIIAKIENKKGLKNLDSIIKESDGIMIARGDLSENVSFEKLPMIQKRIIKLCNKEGKIAITATEMLMSIVKHKSPEKSEITDIANAVLDGSDMLMLSEETTIGKYPALAVKTMAKIIKETEKERKLVK
ncbi:MAG: pyruvate kinase, partial [Nanoarchaeota archaeon]|nr:pyruvate kinase [Nanoarchaeota archaeon]